MKRKIIICTTIVVGMLFFALASSCEVENEKHCTSDAPYWCSSAKACCAYEYHDGHGTCWSSMSGCRSTGYACTVCHLED